LTNANTIIQDYGTSIICHLEQLFQETNNNLTMKRRSGPLLTNNVLGVVVVAGVPEDLVEVPGILLVQVVGRQVTSPTKPPPEV
jgi:hypothetical protein